MFWQTASSDATDHFTNPKFKCGSLSAAVKYCEIMGWGYDIVYPEGRWHTRKSYADNFKWKGNPEEESQYD